MFLQGAWIPTQRASSRLTAVHEASAGLTALVWLHVDTQTHTHTYSQHRELKEQGSALGMHQTREAKQYLVLDRRVSTLTKWKRSLSVLFVPLYCSLLWCVPDSPKLGAVAKSSTLYREATQLKVCVVLSALDLQHELRLAWAIDLVSAICSHFQGDVGRGKKIELSLMYNITFVWLVLTCSRTQMKFMQTFCREPGEYS